MLERKALLRISPVFPAFATDVNPPQVKRIFGTRQTKRETFKDHVAGTTVSDACLIGFPSVGRSPEIKSRSCQGMFEPMRFEHAIHRDCLPYGTRCHPSRPSR
jgi:hypothetical protein